MGSFVIVDLIDETETWVVIVKKNWIDEVGKNCWYPPFRNTQRFPKLLKDGTAPDKNWLKYTKYVVRREFGI